MRKMNKIFDAALDKINHSRPVKTKRKDIVVNNLDNQLSAALEDAYLSKQKEAAEESAEMRHVISQYHKSVLNPDPKMVRLEIALNKLKRRKIFQK